jgi:hypothetical protein
MDEAGTSGDTRWMLILADEEGSILGAFERIMMAGQDSPEQVGIIPSEGQILREVEVPFELLNLDSGDDVFARLRLEYDDESGRLVER